MESKKLRIKVSESQKEMIVTYMENHPDLNKGGLTYTFTKKMRQNLWQELTDQLNSKGTCIKTMDKWIKCWSDLKQEVKKRFSEREQYKNGTGKRPSSKDLSELDLRVLALIGTDGYAGLKVKETAPRIVSSYFFLNAFC
ncbi:unnamed protein product [Larinioides sclopetarius]|uniref:Regulatory protein zeste n=1 Tax=Larinioides sclopetarius TaxID=280406 RepID=A0AAV2BZW0_9ARAC